MAQGRIPPELQGLKGPRGRLYADPQPGSDPTSFQITNNSAGYYNSPYYLAHQKQVQAIPPRTSQAPLDLADFLPPETISAIQQNGKISFHAVGDTGAAKVSRSQSAATAIGDQDAVADAMAADVQQGGNAGPAFFFHLGDIVYNFGEDKYYYDQFYDPYRGYDRPIFAIPGNHDGVVYDPSVPSLKGFLENFCALAPGPAPNAGSLVRSLMTQPGAYFTLDAPFVSIIGLYSNVLESAGVISSQGGHFPTVGDAQLTFLKSELARLKPQRQNKQRAVIVAVHHPTVSVDALHSGSTGIQADLEACCKAAGLWPDMVLHGHAHLYQRFTRTLQGSGQQIPYIISGSGGFAVTAPKGTPPKVPLVVGDHTLEIDPIVDFGYLTVETDGKSYVSAVFKVAHHGKPVVTADSVRVDLAAGKVGTMPARAAAGGKAKPKARASSAPRSARGSAKTSKTKKTKRKR
jgi:calcineurin-like phosphoesterase family protein